MIMIPVSVAYFILGFICGVIAFILFVIFINARVKKAQELNIEKLRKALDELSEIPKNEDK